MSEKKVTDLKSETNILTRILESIKTESKAASQAKLAVIISTLGLFITSLIATGALIYVVVKNGEMDDKLNDANAKADTWHTMYQETERECRIAQLEVDNLKIVMIKAGIEIDHGEKP